MAKKFNAKSNVIDIRKARKEIDEQKAATPALRQADNVRNNVLLRNPHLIAAA